MTEQKENHIQIIIEDLQDLGRNIIIYNKIGIKYGAFTLLIAILNDIRIGENNFILQNIVIAIAIVTFTVATTYALFERVLKK